MTDPYTVRLATPDDAITVGRMAFQMELELWDGDSGGRTEEQYIAACKTLLQKGSQFWALLAIAPPGAPVGVMTLNQCAAIYAAGAFGEIMEFYVQPEFRSRGIGELLLASARSFAGEKGWPFLEVGSPPQPRWSRTLDFYQRHGFREIGPRLELEL